MGMTWNPGDHVNRNRDIKMIIRLVGEREVELYLYFNTVLFLQLSRLVSLPATCYRDAGDACRNVSIN